jgi:hypothetical protein
MVCWIFAVDVGYTSVIGVALLFYTCLNIPPALKILQNAWRETNAPGAAERQRPASVTGLRHGAELDRPSVRDNSV